MVSIVMCIILNSHKMVFELFILYLYSFKELQHKRRKCSCLATVPLHNMQLVLFPGEGIAVSTKVIMHPMYNIRALKHRNVSEFYDYDVALVYVNKSIPLSWKAR